MGRRKRRKRKREKRKRKKKKMKMKKKGEEEEREKGKGKGEKVVVGSEKDRMRLTTGNRTGNGSGYGGPKSRREKEGPDHFREKSTREGPWPEDWLIRCPKGSAAWSRGEWEAVTGKDEARKLARARSHVSCAGG